KKSKSPPGNSHVVSGLGERDGIRSDDRAADAGSMPVPVVSYAPHAIYNGASWSVMPAIVFDVINSGSEMDSKAGIGRGGVEGIQPVVHLAAGPVERVGLNAGAGAAVGSDGHPDFAVGDDVGVDDGDFDPVGMG